MCRRGHRAWLAYRSRLLFRDRWNLWLRLTCYRTMRGYKRPQSAISVSRLLAWCGTHLGRGDADLVLLIA